MTVPKKVWDQMMYLCKQTPSLEWSGVLYYKSEGSPEDLSTFHVTAENIFLKDIGTGGYTEYTTDDTEIDFMMENPELMTIDSGKIHSHNTMAVFHSGTDNQDLWDNSETHNYYLSFIVNNRGDVQVKIAWRAKRETITYYDLKDNQGKGFRRKETNNGDEIVLVVADGDITISDGVDDWFKERWTTVHQEKKSSTPFYNKESKGVISGDYGKTSSTGLRSIDDDFDDYYNNRFNSEKKYSYSEPEKSSKVFSTTPSDESRFLAAFISNDETVNLDNAINKVDKLIGEPLAAWEERLYNTEHWDKMYVEHFGNNFGVKEEKVREKCVSLLKGYKVSNPDVYRELTKYFETFNEGDQQEIVFTNIKE